MVQLSARPIRTADSSAFSLSTGRAPGRPRQTGQTWVFGAAPNTVEQPQNIFVTVFSSTWTSSPSTGSKAATASSYGTTASPVMTALMIWLLVSLTPVTPPTGRVDRSSLAVGLLTEAAEALRRSGGH